MARRAFTLIEVMVVITIILILATILFPVFAQAKRAAERATDLSNLKQMTLAHQMYSADNEGRLVTSWTYGLPGDFTFIVQPYIQNRKIMLSPGRKLSFEELAYACNNANLAPGGVDNPWGEPSVWGYGYNTGHDWDDGTGLTREIDNRESSGGNGNQSITFQYSGTSVTVRIREFIKAGILEAEVGSLSHVMLLGNTGDRIVQGMGRTDLTPLSMYPTLGRVATACDSARLQFFPTWGNAIHIAFADGHAKRIILDLETLDWGIFDAKGVARRQPKLLNSPCIYLSAYDGSNNPSRCASGDAH